MTALISLSFEDDFTILLAPVKGDNPVGEFLLYDPLYDEIRAARRSDDDTLSQGVWQVAHKKADWRAVESLCTKALSERSKDLQIAAWLAEAWIVLEGYQGLFKGLTLLKELCSRFWLKMHPSLTEEDTEHRLHILEWIDEGFVQRLVRLPLTAAHISPPNLTYSDYLTAQQLEQALKKSSQGNKLVQQAQSRGQPMLAQFMTNFAATAVEDHQAHLNFIYQSQEALNLFKELLETFCPQAPSYKAISAHLRDVSHLLENAIPAPLLDIIPETEITALSPATSPDITQETLETPPPVPEADQMNLRAQAYQQLAHIADFLANAEPHSPTPHLLRRIVQWEAKSLPEILHDLAPSPQDMAVMITLFKPPS